MPSRRFPPPWSVEEFGAAFVVKDSAAQERDEPGPPGQISYFL